MVCRMYDTDVVEKLGFNKFHKCEERAQYIYKISFHSYIFLHDNTI